MSSMSTSWPSHTASNVQPTRPSMRHMMRMLMASSSTTRQCSGRSRRSRSSELGMKRLCERADAAPPGVDIDPGTLVTAAEPSGVIPSAVMRGDRRRPCRGLGSMSMDRCGRLFGGFSDRRTLTATVPPPAPPLLPPLPALVRLSAELACVLRRLPDRETEPGAIGADAAPTEGDAARSDTSAISVDEYTDDVLRPADLFGTAGMPTW
mmetsp:Transcript_28739/g.99134  ORF Transcript_28739/g.99134 Transcript_28739/m.99134 type:complete len:208 (+) Transcript_28739:583-1206(+)